MRRYYICDTAKRVGDAGVAEVTTPEAAAGLLDMPGCESYILLYPHPDNILPRDTSVLYDQIMQGRVFYLGRNCVLEPIHKIFDQLGCDFLFPLLKSPLEAFVEELPRLKSWMYPPPLPLMF